MLIVIIVSSLVESSDESPRRNAALQVSTVLEAGLVDDNGEVYNLVVSL